jgi:hypothetical protein
MRTPLCLALGAALCLLLTSCVVTSDNPLSSPDTARADQRLVGDWLGKQDQETFHFTMKKGSWMHVVITQKETGTGNRPSMINRKPEEYDFFPTVIGGNTFLNVVLVGQDDQGPPSKAFVFVRYTISGNGMLQMWRMSQDLAAAAVRAGKLRGTVHQDKSPMMVGEPPHPDMDVALQDTSANIVKFIQNSNVDTLFSDKMEPLYPVKPTGK